jgi:MFS transporter, UMF1 family
MTLVSCQSWELNATAGTSVRAYTSDGEQMPQPSHATITKPRKRPAAKASRGEIWAWACYEIANSTYATVVASALYSAYFVEQIAGSAKGMTPGAATLLLTVIICISALLIVATAPVIGTIADATAGKKSMLLRATVGCVLATAMLGFIKPGDYVAAMLVLIFANFCFGTAEDLLAAFLPELADKHEMGRVSAFGWAAGYVGGLLSLGGCMAYVVWATKMGQGKTEYIPMAMLLCAALFGVASIPTFVWLKERAIPDPAANRCNYLLIGFKRLKDTVQHARQFQDLFKFLFALFAYSCGTTTVLHLSSVYAQQVMKFSTADLLILILVVDVTAAIGAFAFGLLQDQIGSIKTLSMSLGIWIAAIVIASVAAERWQFWVAANLVGSALGASGSAGRALVGKFSPAGKSGEFLGLWGLAVKLATATGALFFGSITFFTDGNYRIALASTLMFFILGILMLVRVNEERGVKAVEETYIEL